MTKIAESPQGKARSVKGARSMGIPLHFPIIKIHDRATDDTRIIGIDSHDALYINDCGGIHYRNLQNSEGTGKYEDYSFVGTKRDEHYPWIEIEFVSLEEAIKPAEEHNRKLEENRKKLEEFFNSEEYQNMVEKWFENR